MLAGVGMSMLAAMALIRKSGVRVAEVGGGPDVRHYKSDAGAHVRAWQKWQQEEAARERQRERDRIRLAIQKPIIDAAEAKRARRKTKALAMSMKQNVKGEAANDTD